MVKKNPPANAGDAEDLGLILSPGRSPAEGNGNTLQYSCLDNSMDRGAGGLQSMGCKYLDMTEHAHTTTISMFFQNKLEIN